MRHGTRILGIVFVLVIPSLVAVLPRIPDVLAAGDPSGGADRGKAPAEILEHLRSGKPQEVIVVFEDRSIQEQALTRREARNLPFEDDEILTFKAHAYAALKEAALRGKAGLTLLQDYSHLPTSFVRLRDEGALIALSRDPRIVSIHENGVSHLFLAESLPLIHQPQAQSAGKTGSGTAVAVLDTGVDYLMPGFGSCPTPGAPGCHVVYAQDFAYPDNSRDNVLHGTRVAGIVLGAAPAANIIALDVNDEGVNGRVGIFDDTVQNAVNWVIAHKTQYNIVAMNMSFGGCEQYASECTGSVYTTMFSNARSAGILPVVASGNDRRTNVLPIPACAPGAVRVGAVFDSAIGPFGVGTTACGVPGCSDSSPFADLVPCWSNSSSLLTLLAPGCQVATPARPVGACGTSYAAPFVAGSAAVLRAPSGFPSDPICKTVQRMTTSGPPVTDPKNNLTTPRLDLGGAIGPLPIGFRTYANPVEPPSGGTGGEPRPGQFSLYPGPEHIAAGDFNGDGKRDLFLHNSSGNNFLAQSNGDGTFVFFENPISPNRMRGSLSNAWGNINTPIITDQNGDGRSDIGIFLAGQITIFRLFLSNGNGTFSEAGGLGGYVSGVSLMVAGDFNGDLRGDLYALWRNSGYNRLFLSNGNGSYQVVELPMAQGDVAFPTSVLVAKFNAGDQQSDLFFHWTNNGVNRLFLTNWGGTSFTQHVNPLSPASVTNLTPIHGDFNANGWDDLIFYGGSGQNKLFFNNGDGNWYELSNPPFGTTPIGGTNKVAVADYNGDYKADVYFYWSSTGQNRIFLGKQDSTFSGFMDPICDLAAISGATFMVPGDYSGDGKGDVFFMKPIVANDNPPWRNSLNISSTN